MQFARLSVLIAISSSLSLSLSLSLGGCVFGDDELDSDNLGSYESELSIENGHNLNGHNLNGHNLNGHNLNGSTLGDFVKYVRYDGAKLHGNNLNNVHLDGSELVARKHHHIVRGTALTGAIFEAKSDEGDVLDLKIAAVSAPSSGDVWRYTVEYRETDGAWLPICLDSTGAVDAVAIDGWWDLRSGEVGDGSKHDNGNRFTFACRNVGALGKCVDAGYRPWASHDGTSLGPYHETCVRLIRADFCGNSVSHTVDGAMVNLFDELGIQVDTDAWVPEAEWTVDGAQCISPHTRAIDAIECADDLLTEDCASGFDPGALLLSEAPADD